MTKRVLIVSNSFDLHADLVTPYLNDYHAEPFRIDLDCFPRDYQIVQLFWHGKLISSITHLPSGQCLNFDEVGAIWLRKPADYAFISNDLAPQELAYAKLETEHALFGLLYPLDCYWMSHPIQLRGAMWKAEQLHRATKFGFNVPGSLVTNCAQQVRVFKQQVPGEIIFKPLSSSSLAADAVAESERIAEGIPTTIIDDAMMNNLEAVNELPCHFQEYVDKQYELRVTVIAGETFAAKIHSQDDVKTAVDSRDISANIIYEATQLPADIAQRCREFVSSYGLNFSALDLIVTPQDEYVFLENNPNGQFLYVEQLIPEFQLVKAVAATLAAEAQCRS